MMNSLKESLIVCNKLLSGYIMAWEAWLNSRACTCHTTKLCGSWHWRLNRVQNSSAINLLFGISTVHWRKHVNYSQRWPFKLYCKSVFI